MKRRLTAQRGSAVLVALCLTVVLGFAVIGYVAVCARTMEMSNRSFCTTSSVQLAEIGIDESLWTLNQALNAFNSGSSYSWSGWTIAGNTVTNQLTGFSTNSGISGTVALQISNFNPQSYNPNDPTTFPVITASGTSQMPDGIPITKQLQVKVRPAALFSDAVGAYSSCSFTINWVCPLDSYDTSISVDYSAQTPTDQAIVSAPTVSVNAANVFGYVATTGTAPVYTTGGTVTRADTPGGVSRDPRYIFTNACQNLFDVVAPTGAGTTVTGVNDLTNPGYPYYLNGHLGTSGASTPSIYYVTGDLTLLSSSDSLTIDGPVIIKIAGNLTVQGTAQIVVKKGVDSAHNGSAQIHVGQRLKIEGSGIDNETMLPRNLAIINTSSGSYSDINYYTAQLHTSVPFYGVIYVPNGSLQLYGYSVYTRIYGAVVANVVDQGYGNGEIHYDLDLRKAVFSTLNTPYEIYQWLISN